MRAAVSPYEVGPAGLGVAAALQVAEGCVTAIPAAMAEVRAVGLARAVEESPETARLVESWAWAGPLWSRGVLGAVWDEPSEAEGGGSLESDVTALTGEIARRSDLPGLARVVGGRRAVETGGGPITAVAPAGVLARDVLLGGADPGVTVPMAAGLERFAARWGLVRWLADDPASVAGKLERRLTRRLASVTLPIVVDGDAGLILEVREACAEGFGAVRAGLAEAAAMDAAGASAVDLSAFGREALDPASSAAEESFRAEEASLNDRAAGGRAAMVRLELAACEPDSALRAAEAAARRMGAGPGAGTRAGATRPPRDQAAALGGRGSLAVFVKRLPFGVW